MLPQSVSIRDFYQRNDTKEYQRFVLFARPKWMIRWMDRWCVSTPSPFFLLSFALMLSTTHPCSCNSALGRHVLNSQDECLAWTKVLNRRWPLNTHLLTLGIPQPVEGPLMKKKNGIFLLSHRGAFASATMQWKHTKGISLAFSNSCWQTKAPATSLLNALPNLPLAPPPHHVTRGCVHRLGRARLYQYLNTS